MLGIVAAFGVEIRDFLKRGGFKVTHQVDSLRFCQSSAFPNVVVVRGAIGKYKARQATTELIDNFKPSRIVSAGFAGGASEEAHTGNLYLCDRVTSLEGPAAYWNASAARQQLIGDTAEFEMSIGDDNEDIRQTIRYGACVSTPQIVSSGSMKKWIGSAFSASVIDMESFWVCECAAERGISRAVVRVVFDPVGQSLPNFIGEAASDGQSIGKAVKHILSRPLDTPKMIRLANQASLASRLIGAFLLRISEKAE